jgi:hypothetical protein
LDVKIKRGVRYEGFGFDSLLKELGRFNLEQTNPRKSTTKES